MPNYDKQFYDDIRETSRHAARTIAPMVIDLIGPVGSVVDVGCGNGVWLSVFKELGAGRVTGLDGAHVDRAMLEIPAEDFIAANLEEPLPVSGPYDLAMTLEVVEHLPNSRAESIVDELCGLAPVVLFSAAIPLQVGEGHINEEWQQVWAERFERRGYRTVDVIRSRIWQDLSVSWWYQQNLLIFAADHVLDADPALKDAAGRTDHDRLSVVHPRLFRLQHDHWVRLIQEHTKLRAENADLKRRLDTLGET